MPLRISKYHDFPLRAKDRFEAFQFATSAETEPMRTECNATTDADTGQFWLAALKRNGDKENGILCNVLEEIIYPSHFALRRMSQTI